MRLTSSMKSSKFKDDSCRISLSEVSDDDALKAEESKHESNLTRYRALLVTRDW